MKKRKRMLLPLLFLFYISAPRALAAAPGDPLVPVGQAVGLQLFCDGVIVSALAEVDTEQGAVSPAAEAGVCPGDRIIEINGAVIHSGEDFLRTAAAFTGEPVRVQAVRHGERITLSVSPAKNRQGVWQLGVWLRDGAHGVGTVTFWDPATGAFGALGHGVSLPGSEELMDISGGVITRTHVEQVTPGAQNVPGELIGAPDMDAVLGIVSDNTPQGVFGSAPALAGRSAVPAASNSQIRLGPATILATVDEAGPREFDAQITRIVRAGVPTRQLTLVVTDPELLRLTGGIVQGMSGSPILQNGRLVGAVTHVLVSDPTKGYGITMESMLAAAQTASQAA